MYQVEFAPLNYYNSIISQECLCVGILFHNLNTGRIDFKSITNFKRFKSFDDEMDPEFIKLYLSGIKDEVEHSIFKNSFSIREYIKTYVNELRFSQPKKLDFKEDEDYVDILTKMFLKFDLSKSKRLSHSEEKKYIGKILQGSNLELLDPNITGAYDEEVKFDYVTDKYAIKVFSFKEKDFKRLIQSVKYWAFTAEEFNKKYKVLFLYDECPENKPESKTILSILSKNAKVFPYTEGFDYITQCN